MHDQDKDVHTPVMGDGYCPIYDAALVGDWERLIGLCEGRIDFHEGDRNTTGESEEGGESDDTEDTADTTQSEKMTEQPPTRAEWRASLDVVGDGSSHEHPFHLEQSAQILNNQHTSQAVKVGGVDPDEHDEHNEGYYVDGPDYIMEEDLQFQYPRISHYNCGMDSNNSNIFSKNHDKNNISPTETNESTPTKKQRRKPPPLFVDAKGNTPLHIACRRNNPPPSAIQALLSLHPHAVFIATHDGWLPLHLACYCGCDVQVASQLLDAMEIEIRLKERFGGIDWRKLQMNDFGRNAEGMNGNGIGVIKGGPMRQLQSDHHEEGNDQHQQQLEQSLNSRQQSYSQQQSPADNPKANGTAVSSQMKIHSHHHHYHHQKEEEEDYDDPLLPRDSKGRTPIHHACASSRDPLRRPDLVRLLLLRSKNPRKAAVARDWVATEADNAMNCGLKTGFSGRSNSFEGRENGNEPHSQQSNLSEEATSNKVDPSSSGSTSTAANVKPNQSSTTNAKRLGRTPLDLIMDDYEEEIEGALSPGFSIHDAIDACRGENLDELLESGMINVGNHENVEHDAENHQNLGTLYECWAIMSVLLLAAGTPGTLDRVITALGGKIDGGHNANPPSSFQLEKQQRGKGRALGSNLNKTASQRSEMSNGTAGNHGKAALPVVNSAADSINKDTNNGNSKKDGENPNYAITALPHTFTKECHDVVKDFKAIHVACNAIGEKSCPSKFTALAKKLVQGEIDKRRIGTVSELRGRWESKLIGSTRSAG